MTWVKGKSYIVFICYHSLIHVISRYHAALHENLLFAVRIIGQFSETKSNNFAQKYIKNGKIQFYKIYKSIWQGKVATQENIQDSLSLIQGLEEKLLEKLQIFTGNYSTVTTLSSVIELFQSMNHSYLNSALESYNTFNTSILTDMNFMTLVTQIQGLLKDIGKVSYEGKTINSWVRKNVRTLLISVSEAAKQYATEADTYKKMVNNAKRIVQGLFMKAYQYLDNLENNPFVTFLNQLMSPMIDNSVEELAKVGAQQLNIYKAMSKGYSPAYTLNFWGMISNLQKAGSSQKYVASLLNAVENYILQNMEETKQNLVSVLCRLMRYICSTKYLSKSAILCISFL